MSNQPTPNAQLILNGFLSSMDTAGRIQVEYIWLGGNNGPSGRDLRSKSRTLQGPIRTVDDLPEWNYDGSSTNQASGHKSEIVIRPRAIFRDPFRGGDHLLAMCDTYLPSGEPTPDNTRVVAKEIFDKSLDSEPWFGIEQEYTLYTLDRHPLGWPTGGFPAPQGPYYCSVGADRAFGRPLVEAHYRACLHAGLHISGINAEVMAGQWEWQIGPVTGIAAGDEMWISRYLIHRLGETFGLVASFDPKPVTGDWNGSGCHTNFSTKEMRESDRGFEIIKEAIEKLGKKHDEHIKVYGVGNERRLTGHHETSPIDRFSWGVGDRGGSIRVPNQTLKDGRGYFEDRRPASNIDPYLVSSKIFKTTCIDQ